MIEAIFRNYITDRTHEMNFESRKELFNYLDKNELYSLDNYEYHEDHMGFVNIYEVTREYGGPEEGGWWYTALRCIESIPARYVHSIGITRWAEEEYKHIKHGNINSVLGGSDLTIMFEDKPSESETRRKPHWDGEY